MNMNDTAVTHSTTIGNLALARDLALPSREAMLKRAPSAQQFWRQNRSILSQAWQEWESTHTHELFTADDSILDASLREAVATAWQDPSSESAVRDLWEEVSPGVYYGQFFDPAKLAGFRGYIEEMADAGIPFRPPYGIALNRRGAMLDQRSEGNWNAPVFQTFYRMLLDRYMRPISRMLFPAIMGYDTQTFGFSIQYQTGMDTSLQPHTDASAATLNINMNLPDETFTGSEVDFYDTASSQVKRLTFAPGTAILHRGNVPHAARPITSGERSNLVLWLYGDRMQIPNHDLGDLSVDAEKRWTVPTVEHDHFAPF